MPYLDALNTALQADGGWALVQPLLSSSLHGWGMASLDSDAVEIGLLLSCLAGRGVEAVVLCGHSTGCQSSVHFFKSRASHEHKALVKGVVLQAPVSDREYMCKLPGADKRLAAAQALVAAGRSLDCLPRSLGGCWLDEAAISAERYISLATREGDDDLFSSDLSDKELEQRLGHVAVPVLALFSGEDEYVSGDDVHVKTFAARMQAAMVGSSKVKCIFLDGARHAPHKRRHIKALINAVMPFLGEVTQ